MTPGRVYFAGNCNGAGELVLAPSSYGSRGRDASIRFTIADSRHGQILVAATAHGVCWIAIHSDVAYLESELRADFPEAREIVRDDSAVITFANQIVAYASGATADLDLPVDVRATPFQFAVWRELCLIPRGSTRSYGEIARRLGNPGASRAVGHANGSNPLAIAIPCHRAIGSNGRLTGYRWGVEYKRRLLEQERATAQAALNFPTPPRTIRNPDFPNSRRCSAAEN